MPAIKSAPRSKVAPCTARLANQPSAQPTLSIVSAAMTVRSKVGILPHSQMLGICKTILRGAPGRQARDRAPTPDAGTRAERDRERRKGFAARACHLWRRPRPPSGEWCASRGVAARCAVVAALGVRLGQPQEERLQLGRQGLGEGKLLAQSLAQAPGGFTGSVHGCSL